MKQAPRFVRVTTTLLRRCGRQILEWHKRFGAVSTPCGLVDRIFPQLLASSRSVGSLARR